MPEREPPTNLRAVLTLILCASFIPYLGLLQRFSSSRPPLSTGRLVSGAIFCASVSGIASEIVPSLGVSPYLPSQGVAGTLFRLAISFGLLCFLIAALRPARSVAVWLDGQFRVRRWAAEWKCGEISGEAVFAMGVDPVKRAYPLRRYTLRDERMAEVRKEVEEVEQLELLEYLLASSLLLVAVWLLSLVVEDVELPFKLIVAGYQHAYLRTFVLMLPSAEAFLYLLDAVNRYLPLRWRGRDIDPPRNSMSKFNWRRGVLPVALEIGLAVPYYVLYGSLMIALVVWGVENDRPPHCECACNQ